MDAENLDDLFRRLEKLNDIGVALSQERDINRLLESILVAAKSITHADGGTLYRVSEDRRHLCFEIMHTDSLGLRLGGTTGNPITLPDLSLRTDEGKPNNALVAAYACLHGKTVNIADAYDQAGFDFSGTRQFDQRTGYRSVSFLTVPMKDHENEVIGVLQLINAIDPRSKAVVPFSYADQRLLESLASQAAIALNNRALITQLEKLFESFIGLINVAIDEKSPYTGGHCERVPELTMMLAEAAHATTTGPLADFKMDDHDRYELKIAGLLHDCGKVTTPVHVVDKATKLQTIFDRIHLVDTRFEVLKRDAEIEALKRKLLSFPPFDKLRAGRVSPERESSDFDLIDAELTQTVAHLDADRNFLRHANIGVEHMPEEERQRVRDIGAAYQWRNAEGDIVNFLTAEEIENLAIRSGTLTTAERDVINHHIVSTIKMLEQLPWPHHLEHVPEYAGGHHERMDGKGYPKGLTREQMSVQARIMGIADIFEALTARDRPYKHGMKLSQAVSILAKFACNDHIDADLFEVFVRENVYRRYAQAFLEPAQIDWVDDEAALRIARKN